jgi:succinate dehydrogenase/fumarate reductase cytochrome b subunit (b558 family)
LSDTPTKPLTEKAHRAFLLRKLHSLSGVLPVGAFMCFHLFENARALQGQAQFDEAVAGINHLPFLPVVEWVTVLLPLAFHAGYGVKLALESKPNVGHYTYSRNWMYLLQRVTGLLALLFILFHLYEYWFQKLVGKLAPEQFYPALCQNMAYAIGPVPVTGLIYAIGLSACVFHFANGLYGFCFSWGITSSRRSQQRNRRAPPRVEHRGLLRDRIPHPVVRRPQQRRAHLRRPPLGPGSGRSGHLAAGRDGRTLSVAVGALGAGALLKRVLVGAAFPWQRRARFEARAAR